MFRAALLFLAGCGRIAFEPLGSVDAAPGIIDGVPVARPELVQSPGVQQGAADTQMSVALSPTRAGSLLVVATLNFNIPGPAPPTTSITDDAGNVYVDANSRASWNGTDGVVEIWYAADVRAGASTVTIASAGVTSRSTWVLELANMDPDAPLDAVATINDGPANGAPTGPAVIARGPWTVIVSVIMISGAVTQIQPGNDFLSLSVLNGDGAAYLITDQPGAHAAVWDAPGSDNFGGTSAAFLGLAAD